MSRENQIRSAPSMGTGAVVAEPGRNEGRVTKQLLRDKPTDLSSFPGILSVGTALPARKQRQEDIYEGLIARTFSGRLQRVARRIFSRSGVEHRHTVTDLDECLANMSTAARNDRYVDEAVRLAAEAIRGCLTSAGATPLEIDDFIFVSSSGIDVPSLDLRLAGKIGMRPDLFRLSVVGMGCNGAVPGLVRAMQSASLQPGRKVLVTTVELSSLHFQFEDSLENVVVSALFSDGAAAALISTDGDGDGPWLTDAASYSNYRGFEHISSTLTDHGFQGRMSIAVADEIEAHIEDFVDTLLNRNGLQRRDVRFWCLHPGGPKILDRVEARLGIPENALAYSRGVLRDYGNMSSSTVMFVLDRIRQSGPIRGDVGVLVSFGPGLTLDGILLRW